MQSARPESSPACGDSQAEDDMGFQEHQQTAATIYDVADACYDIFDRLVSAVDGDSSLEQAFLIFDPDEPDESPREFGGLRNNFAFWVDYTGALIPVEASLDTRLHGHDEIKETVMDLLEMVHRNLRRLEQIKDEGPTFPNAEVQRSLRAIGDALDRLHFLARLIRKASASKQLQVIFEPVSEDDKLFHDMAISYVKWKCPNARPSLREHMGKHIAGRRRVLLQTYWHARRLKTRRPTEPSPALMPQQRRTRSVEQHAIKLPIRDAANLPNRGVKSQGGSSAAGSRVTEASKADGKAVWQQPEPKPALSTRSSGSSQQEISPSAEYPDPPHIKDEMRKETNNRYWRRHIDQHLQSYVCLFRQCANSCFDQLSDWRNHMSASHSWDWPRKVHSIMWFCDIDHHEPVAFDNEKDWRKHLTDLSLHPERSKPPTDTQMNVLAIQMQQIALRDPYVCPFCEDKPQQIAILGDGGNSTDMMEILLNHIAEHMKSLSFLSLPGVRDEAVRSDKGSAKLEDSAAAVRLGNSDSSPKPPSGPEFLEGISLTFHDYGSEPGSELHRKPPSVVEIDPEFTTEHSEDDVSPIAEIPIPDTEPNFSWDFIPQANVPLGDVDEAFGQWLNDGGGSIAEDCK